MNPKDAKEVFEAFVKATGTPMDSLLPEQGVRLMLEFYRNVRADGCDLENDGDMLLCQWHTNHEGDTQSFQLDVTRQFITADAEDDDAISQLSLTFHVMPTAENLPPTSGDRWCSTPEALGELESFIRDSEIHQLIAEACASKVTLEYGGV